MRVVLAVWLLTAGAAAANPALLDFMGGQGCTFGPESRAAAVAAGFAESDIDALTTDALAKGTAKRERDYVVLAETVCTIRLPDIESAYTVTSPEIVAVTTGIDEYAAEGHRGCFLPDLSATFDALTGGDPDARDYFAFIAAGIIAGDVRFYSSDPLATPLAFQVVSGACSQVANIDNIRDGHALIASGFETYVRRLGAGQGCDGLPFASPGSITAEMQGIDPDTAGADDPSINAWLHVEYDVIARAAGWYDGMTAASPGKPRPPLCHYP